MKRIQALAIYPLILAIFFLSGCGKSSSEAAKSIISVEGSDTMVNVAQAWAEQYGKVHPEISVQVLGGGSGVGIASLIDGNCDMADASRKMKDKELARAKARRFWKRRVG